MSNPNFLFPDFYRDSTLLESDGLPNLVALFLNSELGRRQLLEGDRFPINEEVLGKILGVGRGTVHEAWKILRDKGVIYIRRGVGVVVKDPSALFNNDLFEVFFEIRKEAERGLIKLAIERLTTSRLSLIEKALDNLILAADELSKNLQNSKDETERSSSIIFQLFNADLKFHSEIHKAANEPWLTMISEIAEAATQTMWYHGLSYSTGLDELIERHKNIMNAIKSKDVAYAIRSMEEHFQHAQIYGFSALKNIKTGKNP